MSFSVIGFLGLANAERVASSKPNGKEVWHCFYTTTLQCSSGIDIPAKIRIYSPFNDVVHVNDTVAYVIARAFCPPNKPVLLDTYHIFPVPGNPANGAEYKSRVPDCPHPFVSGIGIVSGRAKVLADGVTKFFPVVVSDYVQESKKVSTVQFVYFHRLYHSI